MSRRTILLLALVVLAALALAACGGGAASSGSSATALNVTLTTTEFKYDPAVINATPGQTINLTVKNSGSIQHTFVFASANVKVTVDPGKSVTQTFTAPAAAGTYAFDCDIAGHKEAGMVGQLIVK
jgi:plastocyanin